MRLYEILFRRIARPVGITLSIIIAIFGARSLTQLAFGTTDQERKFAEMCTIQDGHVKKIAGNYWCVKGGLIESDDGFPSSIPKWIEGCHALGGTVHDPSRNYTEDEICVKEEIVFELGTRNDFVGGQ